MKKSCLYSIIHVIQKMKAILQWAALGFLLCHTYIYPNPLWLSQEKENPLLGDLKAKNNAEGNLNPSYV